MKQKDILFILVSSTLVVGLWIVFNIVHNTLTSTISTDTSQSIMQISSTFDTKTLQLLKKRTAINPQTVILVTPTAQPTPTIPPITPVSPLQSLSVPIASQGGTP